MTIIAAFTNGRSWAIGSDSGFFEEDTDIYFRTHLSKIAKFGKTLAGFAGTCSVNIMEVILAAAVEEPREIATAMRRAEASGDWTILAVNDKGVYYIGDDFACLHLKGNYMAVGGAGVAGIGALYVGEQLRIEPKTAVKYAVQSAITNHTAAISPVKILTAGETNVLQ